VPVNDQIDSRRKNQDFSQSPAQHRYSDVPYLGPNLIDVAAPFTSLTEPSSAYQPARPSAALQERKLVRLAGRGSTSNRSGRPETIVRHAGVGPDDYLGHRENRSIA
jgi:hypothetical protein